MKNLIIQGMIKLLEQETLLKVRQEDIQMTKGVLNECEKEFHQYMKKETERDYHCKLHILEDQFLTVE